MRNYDAIFERDMAFARGAHRIVAVLALSVVQGCEAPPELTSKYSAEENGYLTTFEAPLRATCQVGTISRQITGTMPMEMPCGMSPMGTPVTCMGVTPVYGDVAINSFADTGQNPTTTYQEIAIVAPPEGLSETHESLLQALRSERDGAVDRTLYADACSSLKLYQAAVEDRIEEFATTNSIYLTFSPVAGAEVTLDSRDGLTFEVAQSLTVPTAYGDLTAGYRDSRGIQTLRVIFEGQQRIFTLDRPFEFYIPSGYATRVSYSGTDELVLIVVRE